MVNEPKPVGMDQVGASVNVSHAVSLLSAASRARFAMKLGLNAHAIVEAVLSETCKESSELRLVCTDVSLNSQLARAVAIGLLLQGLREITLFRCVPLLSPEKASFGFKQCEGTETWLVGVGIDDVEYIVHPADLTFFDGIVLSILGPESHLGRSSLYIRRVITDKLRETNPAWDPVAFPLWVRTVPDKIPVYYKAIERVLVTLELPIV